MKRFSLLILVSLLAFNKIHAQHVIDGTSPGPSDSVTFTFEVTDSLHYDLPTPYISVSHINIDTSGTHLWQIGKTNKTFFADSTDTTFAIMTDTLNVYPVNANDWFVLKMRNAPFNVIIDFWHKYQTTAGHDGGIVEFSIDSGITWQNVLGDCHVDSPSMGSHGIYTDNFYGKNDTLLTGEQAFSGTSSGWQYSRLQFFMSIPERRTGGSGCNWDMFTPLYVRFRFESDSVTDSLAGWMIDSIKIEADNYGSSVEDITHSFDNRIYPNPSVDGIFNFPVLNDGQDYKIEVCNALGQQVLNIPYTCKIDLHTYPKGIYFYKITNGAEYYSGHLVTQ